MELLPRYERDARVDQLERWRQQWAQEGWLATGDPEPVGQDATGAPLVRCRLERTVASRHRPSQPYLALPACDGLRSPGGAAASGRAASPAPP